MAVFTFINAWFVSLFFVLPFHATPEKAPADKDYAAAPVTPRWKRVAISSALLALVFTLIIWALIMSDLFPMRPWLVN